MNDFRDEKRLGTAFWLLVVYFVFEYGRVQDYLLFLRPLKIPLILTILLIFMWLRLGDRSALKEPLVLYFLVFLILIAIGSLFAVNTFWVYQYFQFLSSFLLAGVLPSIAFLSNAGSMAPFMRIWIVINTFLAVMGILVGGVGSSSFLADENDLALVLNMAIPFPFFLSQSPKVSKVMKIIYLTITGVLVLGVATTLSRGGFVGLVVVVGAMLWYSPKKTRNLILIGVVGYIVFQFLPASYVSEMETIENIQEGTAADRLYSWRRGWEMFLDNPILGVGAGNYPWRVAEYELISNEFDPDSKRLHGGRAAHSLYFTLLPELGIAGSIVFISMTLLMFRTLRRVTSLADRQGVSATHRELGLLGRAMMASLMTYLATGSFVSVLYYPHFWYLTGFVIALDYSVRKLILTSQKTVTAAAGA